MKPREVLIKSLSDIDSNRIGFEPDSAVVILSKGDTNLAYLHSGQSRLGMVGAVSLTLAALTK